MKCRENILTKEQRLNQHVKSKFSEVKAKKDRDLTKYLKLWRDEVPLFEAFCNKQLEKKEGSLNYWELAAEWGKVPLCSIM